MRMPRVRFIPEGISVEVREGDNLLRAAIAADVQVTASCGGDGTCGKCRVVVESGEVRAGPSAKLSQAQRDDGHVLACQAVPTSDVEIRVPVESRPGDVPARDASEAPSTMLSSEEFDGYAARLEVDPPIARRTVEMSAPDLSDNASDATRLVSSLRRQHGIEDAEIDIETMRALPHAVRDGDWTLTADALVQPRETRVVRVMPGSADGAGFAVAVDLGTTTVEAQLLDLSDGRVVAQASEYNAQVGRGEDVITRIIAGSDAKGLAELQDLALRSVRNLVSQMLESTAVETDEVVSYVFAGNTVMTHLLLGLTPRNIRPKPYIPAASRFPWIRASELGLPGSPSALAHCLPCPASYVGGDIVGGLVAAGVPWTEKLSLFVDIGTNGEIVLGNRSWLVACSCSAGPAFEGGGVLHGMRAADGAIEQVRIHRETLEPMFLTIGGTLPLGICGSGLMDTMSELFLAGALDRNGAFVRDLENPHLREGDHGMEYVIAWGDTTATGDDIVLTEVDVENLIRAKAAVFAGIGVLVESVDVDFADIEQVLIAGAFGHYLDLERVMTLGLLPELETERFTFVGNGSLIGARMAAVSRGMLETAEKVAEQITYLELSVNASFMENYVSAMFLPHTDLSLFPRSEDLLRSRVGDA
jgi:uncharacterized 2Fe-2S/4Fe-4S cluster protein (DUF4445 family)